MGKSYSHLRDYRQTKYLFAVGKSIPARGIGVRYLIIEENCEPAVQILFGAASRIRVKPVRNRVKRIIRALIGELEQEKGDLGKYLEINSRACIRIAFIGQQKIIEIGHRERRKIIEKIFTQILHEIKTPQPE